MRQNGAKTTPKFRPKMVKFGQHGTINRDVLFLRKSIKQVKVSFLIFGVQTVTVKILINVKSLH